MNLQTIYRRINKLLTGFRELSTSSSHFQRVSNMRRKRCSVCKETKSLNNFYINHDSPDMPSSRSLTIRAPKHRPECKECTLAKRRLKRQIMMVDL